MNEYIEMGEKYNRRKSFKERAEANREKRLSENEAEFILALETSCDETSAAVITSRDGRPEIISHEVASQIEDHKKFGGVVPEIASRRHLELIRPMINSALEQAGVDSTQLTAAAATRGPGLVGALLVGFAAGKALAYAEEIPFLGVNHIAGHIFANFLVHEDIELPFLCLTVSGGHTDLIYFSRMIEYEILGRTRDDAAGEAFDKIARRLELGYPGGPAIEKKAREGNPEAVELPRALSESESYDFSFSGLKTAVINYIHNQQQKGNEIDTADLSASFQRAVIESLLPQVERAIKNFEPEALLLAGGVSANSLLRSRFESLTEEHELSLYLPPLDLCTDNAAMIGAAAYYQLAAGHSHDLGLDVKANLSL